MAMRTLLLPLLTLAVILLTGGCTHADGPSDALWGNWQLTGVEASEEASLAECSLSPQNWFVAFQASVVRIIHEEGVAAPLPCFGTFSREGGKIVISFPDDNQPVLWRAMGWERSNCFVIENLTADRLVLKLEAESSAPITYIFRKW